MGEESYTSMWLYYKCHSLSWLSTKLGVIWFVFAQLQLLLLFVHYIRVRFAFCCTRRKQQCQGGNSCALCKEGAAVHHTRMKQVSAERLLQGTIASSTSLMCNRYDDSARSTSKCNSTCMLVVGCSDVA